MVTKIKPEYQIKHVMDIHGSWMTAPEIAERMAAVYHGAPCTVAGIHKILARAEYAKTRKIPVGRRGAFRREYKSLW